MGEQKNERLFGSFGHRHDKETLRPAFSEKFQKCRAERLNEGVAESFAGTMLKGNEKTFPESMRAQNKKLGNFALYVSYVVAPTRRALYTDRCCPVLKDGTSQLLFIR